jgi:hypothetical protein
MFSGPWKVPMFGGLWRVPMFAGQLKLPIFGGPWKVPMEGSIWKKKKKHPFHLFSLSPQQFYLNLFFLIDFKVLLYHGSRPLLYVLLSFSLTYKL